tara:strand:- start:57771 stop:58097 length:327 start_codon:yes stop_codon:yes gene_type:complete
MGEVNIIYAAAEFADQLRFYEDIANRHIPDLVEKSFGRSVYCDQVENVHVTFHRGQVGVSFWIGEESKSKEWDLIKFFYWLHDVWQKEEAVNALSAIDNVLDEANKKD